MYVISDDNFHCHVPVYGNVPTGGSNTNVAGYLAGNITTGNINNTGSITSTGNITAPNFIGNLVGNLQAPGANSQVMFNLNNTIAADDGLVFDSVANTLTVGGKVVTANGGNVEASGQVSAVGNVTGGNIIDVEKNGHYVTPAIVEFDKAVEVTKKETFAPILYCIPYDTIDKAIQIQNDVPQGLSSCIFSRDLLETEKFLSANGSDCGLVNINVGPSGAEIGGAFGGEKDTGGGRESGSDAWKAYMRRVTVTTNFSSELPLSQGIEFNI